MISASHSAHDYKYLTARWRKLARESGLTFHNLDSESESPVFYLKSKALKKSGGFYFSAGIHGDEVGATEGLIRWAELHRAELNQLPVMLVPCLNPWGLVHNSRLNEHGSDLNRLFQRDDIPVIQNLKNIVKPYRFETAMMLHEDYDGRGVYLYELKGPEPYWGESLLDAALPFLPLDSRNRIEGRKAVAGLVRRKIKSQFFKKFGLPEAGYFYMNHAARTFTTETPSEFSLDQRVQAQVAMIEECVKKATLNRVPVESSFLVVQK